MYGGFFLLRDAFQHTMTFGWPLYDLRYHLWNVESKKLYCGQRNNFPLNNVQRRIVRELREFGISIIHIDDLFSDMVFARLQRAAETLVQKSEVGKAGKVPYRGRGALSGSEKYYVVRPLGMRPVRSFENEFLSFSLSDEILRIVCSYFDMFCRLLDLELWCNIPTDGPDQFSQRWHRDPDDKKQVKTFLYLRDVDEGTGPF